MKRKSETMTATVATRKQYSETTIKWAEQMLLSGVAPSEVARQTGIDGGYARTLKFRLGVKEIKPARVHDSEILREFVALKPVTEMETPVADVTETTVSTRYKPTRLDVVFYATTLTACAGLVTLLRWWGLPVSLVYSLILWDAMETAKDPAAKKSAETGAGAVIVLEIIAACVHTYFFNHLVWRSYKSLPWDMSQKIVGGELIWPNSDKPFLIAVCIAVMLSCAAVYAIHKSIITTRERVKTPVK